MKRDNSKRFASEAKAAGEVGAVRKKNIACQQCVDERQAAEALRSGVKMLSKQSKGYREYRWLSCGHTGRYKTSAVRIGSIMCRKCR